MFRNYLTIALRNIVRHKLYSFINIAGLAIGLTCVILIALFVRDELSYDKWIAGSDRLYRVEMTFYPPGRPPIPLAQTSMPLPLSVSLKPLRAAVMLSALKIERVATLPFLIPRALCSAIITLACWTPTCVQSVPK